MTEKDRIQYIQVLLALDGHHDLELHDTLDKAKKTTEKKPSFWKRFKKGCVMQCVMHPTNAVK